MKLDQWQKTPQLVQWAMRTFGTASGRELLRMLEDSHPRHTMLAFGVPDTALITKLGQNEGYQLALNNIEAAMKLVEVEVQEEATFGAEEILKAAMRKQ